MKNLFLIDLDDTLFNTQKFKLILKEFLRDYYKVNIENFISEYDQVKVENKDLYSLFYHVKKHKQDISEEEIKSDFRNYFTDPDFLFDYTEELINYLNSNQENKVIIFTFGDKDYQNLKMSLHNILKSQEKIIVQSSKKKFLDENIEIVDGLFKLKNFNETFERIIYIDDYVEEGIHSKDKFIVYNIEKGSLDLKHLLSLLDD